MPDGARQLLLLPPPRRRKLALFSLRGHQGLRRAEGPDQARIVGVVVPECQRPVLHRRQPEGLPGVIKQEGYQGTHFNDACRYTPGTLQNTW